MWVICRFRSPTPKPLLARKTFRPVTSHGTIFKRCQLQRASDVFYAPFLASLSHRGVNWRPPLSGGTTGYLYSQLRTRIQSLKLDPASVNPSCKTRACRWFAFVWFQGEADSDGNPEKSSANADAYEQNLKNLIADVHKEVGSPTLPVVIVQTGAWAQGLSYGKIVAAAQTSVVNADKYTRIVTTSDLSKFYHYDPAAQLIIGERVALAVQSLGAAVAAPK